MARVRHHARRRAMIPLLSVLKSMRPEHRIVVLAHLDDATRDAIYETITDVLQSDKVPIQRRLFLRSKLADHRSDLRYLTDKKRSKIGKKKKLTQVGGAPMYHVLRAALPLMLQLYK